MTSLADHLSKFLREHLPRDRKASPHTCEAYAYRLSASRLLCCQPPQSPGCVPGGGVRAVGKWPAGATVQSLAEAGHLSTAVVIATLR